MTRVLHVLDRTCGWEQRVALTQLLGGERAGESAGVLALGGPPPGFDNTVAGCAVASATASAVFAAPALRRRIAEGRAEVVHAWGPEALTSAASAVSAAGSAFARLAISVFDPGLSDEQVKRLSTVSAQLSSDIAVICAAERVRRRLVERGVPFERCVVVRPGVDFAVIKAVDAPALRAALGIRKEMRWFVIPPPLSRRDGHQAALWAVLMRRYLDEPVHLTIPGTGPRVEELKALAAASRQADTVSFSGETQRFEELCVAADDLVLGDVDEIPMTAAAWAMAGSTLISAPATYATTEMLANDLNGKLFKAPDGWRRRAARLAARLDPAPDAAKVREVARGQAYEVFSRRRFVRQVDTVYTNLVENRAPADGIGDPAMVGAADRV